MSRRAKNLADSNKHWCHKATHYFIPYVLLIRKSQKQDFCPAFKFEFFMLLSLEYPRRIGSDEGITYTSFPLQSAHSE